MSNSVTSFAHAPSRDSGENARATVRHARVAGLDFASLTEAEVVAYIVGEAGAGRGGWVATPNVDICRQSYRDPAAGALVRSATLVVPDGMPLIWASRLRGDPLPERVSGSSLIYTLSREAAGADLSVYFLGGPPGVPDKAGATLARRYPGLRVAGADSPPFGFDASPAAVAAMHARVHAAQPDIVFVGLGFPKQERVIAGLTPICPRTWFVGCGAAISFAAVTVARAPAWMQRAGLEWLFRLLKEPRRLFRRYLIDDLPFAAGLLASTCARRGWAALTGRARNTNTGLDRPAP